MDSLQRKAPQKQHMSCVLKNHWRVGKLRNSEGARKGPPGEPEMAMSLRQNKGRGEGHWAPSEREAGTRALTAESGLESESARPFSPPSRYGGTLLRGLQRPGFPYCPGALAHQGECLGRSRCVFALLGRSPLYTQAAGPKSGLDQIKGWEWRGRERETAY